MYPPSSPSPPDALHAYFGVCGLSLLAEPGVKQMDAALNVSRDASSHLTDLHAAWRCHRLRLRPADAAQTTLLRRLTDAVTTGYADVDGVDGWATENGRSFFSAMAESRR